MTQEQLNAIAAVSEHLNDYREKLRKACGGVGEPCVELPINEVKAFKDEEGNWRAIIGMDQLIYFIDGLLRRPLS